MHLIAELSTRDIPGTIERMYRLQTKCIIKRACSAMYRVYPVENWLDIPDGFCNRLRRRDIMILIEKQ